MDISVLASSSQGNCYLISDTVTTIMIECGIPIKQIKKGCDYKIHEIAGCLISHGH